MSLNLTAFLLACFTLLAYILLNRKQISNHPLSIANIYLFSFIVFYFADTTYTTFEYEGIFRISNTTFEYLNHDITEIWLFYTASALITLSIFSYKQNKVNVKIRQKFILLADKNFITLPLFIAFGAVIASLAILAAQISTIGFMNYFGNLALRSELFSDTTIQNALVSTAISTYTLCIALWQTKNPKKLTTLLLLTPVIILAVFTGARAALIEIAFVYIFVRSYTKNDIKLNWKTLALLPLALVALTNFAMQTRTHADTDITGPVARTFESEQVPQSENGLNIISNNFTPKTNTVLEGYISFVPRQILEKINLNKGDGGNAVYTAEFIPYRWHEQNSQISLGGLNEILMNMGWLGLAYIAIISLLIRFTLSIITQNRYTALCIPALTWSAFQFLRGDTYHTINKLFTFLFGILIIYIAIHIYNSFKRSNNAQRR